MNLATGCTRTLGVGLLALSLFWASPGWAVEVEGPLTGRAPQGAPGVDRFGDYVLGQVRIENDGAHFRLLIPVEAPWAHSTLENPQRIVIDLGQTRSALPKAPGLYEVRLDRGAVAILRTSQFRYAPRDHRVRLALELTQKVPFSAHRVKEGIEIVIPDPVTRTPESLVIGGEGLVPAHSEGSLPEQEVSEQGHPENEQTGPVAGEETGEETCGDESAGEGDLKAESATVQDPRDADLAAGEPPPRTLRDALTRLIRHSRVDPVGGPSSDEALLPGGSGSSTPPREAAATGQAPPSEASGTHAPASKPAVAPPPAKSVFHPEIGDLIDPIVGPKPSPHSPEQLVRDLAGAISDTSKEGSEAIGSGDLGEHGAARLLHKAVAAYLRGEEEKAAAAADRAHHFYPNSPSGAQAALLLRELLVLVGHPMEADTVSAAAESPDSTKIPREVFIQLVQRYEDRGDYMEVNRLLHQWSPSYGPIPGHSRLHLALGKAFAASKKPELAREQLEQIAAGDPNEGAALIILAGLQESAGDKEKALELYRRVTDASAGPWRARSLARQADLEFQMGQVPEALVSYETLLEADPPSDEEVWAIYQSGNCHYLLGELGQARVRYDTVTQRWPQSFWAPHARERLEEMLWREQLLSKGDESSAK